MSVSELKYPKNRLRRTRQAKWIRNLTQENMLSTNDLVWPVFVCEGNNIKEEIQSMPNVYRYSIDNLNEVYDIASEHKINLIAVFPFTPQELKTKYGDEGRFVSPSQPLRDNPTILGSEPSAPVSS